MHLNVTPDTTLCSGTLTATLAPAAGGRVTSLSSRATAGERIDWLVPLDDGLARFVEWYRAYYRT